jgi:hypothetical protein
LVTQPTLDRKLKEGQVFLWNLLSMQRFQVILLRSLKQLRNNLFLLTAAFVEPPAARLASLALAAIAGRDDG